MVTIYGLNDKLGNISYYDSSGQREFAFGKPYSEETAKIIDAEISKVIEEQYERAKDILRKHKDKLHKLAEKLLEKEVIFKEDLEEIFGARPFDKDKQATSNGNGASQPSTRCGERANGDKWRHTATKATSHSWTTG